MNSLYTIVLDKIVYKYLIILIMNTKDRISTSPKHVTLQNYVIEFIEREAKKHNRSFSKQLNNIVKNLMRTYE